MPNSKLKHYLVEMVYVDFHLGLLGMWYANASNVLGGLNAAVMPVMARIQQIAKTVTPSSRLMLGR
jgi:hypothetical protein